MANKEFHVRKGLIVANSVLVTNGVNVGVNTTSPSVALHIAANDAIIIPVGTTAQRPSAAIGQLRFNSETSDLEFYVPSNTAWKSVKGIADASAANATAASLGSTTNTHVLFDDSDSFGGSAGLTFNKTTNNVTIGNNLTVATTLNVTGALGVNSTGAYVTGLVNATAHNIGSTMIANTLGVYHSGTMNAASFSLGATFVANSTYVYHSSGIITAPTIASLGGAGFIANSTTIYHSAKIECAAGGTGFYTPGIFQANNTHLYHVGDIQGTRIVVSGGQMIANTSGVYHNGLLSAPLISTSASNWTANNTAMVLGGSTIFYANGSAGTSGHVLHTNGSGTYWAADDEGVTSVASGNGITGGTITTTGTLSVVQGTGTVVNTSGVHVNSSYIATISANNASFLGGTAAASYLLSSTAASTYAALAGATFSGATTHSAGISATASGHAITGRSTTAGNGGLLGYTQDSSKYGLVGYTNSYSLYGVGDIYCSGAIQATGNITAYFSDRRLKKNIRPIYGALEMLREIGGYFFEHNEIAAEHGYKENETQIGVIAQEVEKVVPLAVSHAPFDQQADDQGNISSKTGEWYKTVDMTKLIPVLIQAIKELEDRVNGY